MAGKQMMTDERTRCFDESSVVFYTKVYQSLWVLVWWVQKLL